MTRARIWFALGAVMAVCAAGAPAAARTEGLGSSSLEKSAVSTKNGGSRLSDRLLTLSGQGFTRRSKAQQSAALGLPATGPGSLLRGPHGTVVVEARLDSAEEAVFQGLTAAGAKVTARADAERRVSMQVPISKLRDVANVPGVAWVGETLAPRVGKTVGDGPAGAIDPDGVGTRGSCSNRLITEGDTQLRAAQARSTYGVDGSGVTVGVLSDSYDTLGGAATDVSNGELPGVGNPCGRTNPVQIQAELNQTGTDEGRAMAQIVHDIAPGAGIRFATANNGEVDFANQIRALASAGAKVIVDDIYYFAEPVYQDGAVAKAVSDVSSQGVAYFSAAGNDNIILGGKNVASYEAMAYRPTSCPAAVGGVGLSSCHDFASGAGVDATDMIRLSAGGSAILKLDWNEPTNGVTTDIDLFVLDDAGDVVASSMEDNPNGSQKPFEIVGIDNYTGAAANYRIVLGKYGTDGGTPRLKTILMSSDVTDVEYDQSTGGDVVGPTIFGHSASKEGANVAAVPYDDSSEPEEYSSRGPGSVCYGPIVDSTPATLLPGGCETRTLTVAATDGGRNSFFGDYTGSFYRFYGTSAAAPHAAAVAALQLEQSPCATGADLIDAQKSSARAVGSFGVGAVGSGLVTADEAIADTVGCSGPPSAPVGAFAVAGVGNATVNWSAAAPNGSPVTGYTVIPYVNGVAQAPHNFGNVLGGTVTGLSDGTTYTFRVSATNAHGTGPLSPVTNAVTPGATTEGTVYVPITPCRVLDTRKAGGSFSSSEQRAIQIAGTGITGQGGKSSCIPDGAAAAELSISALAAPGAGYTRAWPNGQSMPTATFLNYNNAQGTTNTGAVPLAPTGTKDLILRNAGTTHGYVIDVQGYYVPPATAPGGSVYVPITPCRVLDTRHAGGPLAAGGHRDIQVAGSGITGQGANSSCVPDGVTAVEASISAVSPTRSGYLRAWPRGLTQPTATFVNYSKGKGTTNTGAVTLAATGKLDLSLYNGLGAADFVVDVQGYFVPAAQVPNGATGSLYVPITPCRVLDTRKTDGPLSAGTITQYQVAGGIITDQGGMAGCIPDGATSAEASVSAVAPASTGYTRAWPANVAQPSATIVNYTRHEGTTNTGSVSLAPTGVKDLAFGNFLGRSDYVIDIQGYWTPLTA